MISENKRCKEVDGTLLPNVLAWLLANITHLALCIYHRVRGYTSPGTSPHKDIDGAHSYNMSVVNGWLSYLPDADFIAGKDVLELCPGPDLGAGLLLLARGARSYTAIDVNRLVDMNTQRFYDRVLADFDSDLALSLKEEMRLCWAGQSKRLRYVCDPSFNLAALGKESVDVVFSQAALEHFPDPTSSLRQLAEIVRPGARLVIQVDLKTHTPWVRDVDPLSIYRISKRFYKRLSYPGVPNRVRIAELVDALVDSEWENVAADVTSVVSPRYLKHVKNSLAQGFRDDSVGRLSCYLLAERGLPAAPAQ